MIEEKSVKAFEDYLSSARKTMDAFLDGMKIDEYRKAAEMILDAQAKGGRIQITGIGKPGHVAEFEASLFSSTGNPTYFLHGTEAVHGSCGQLAPEDVVICISNSGETGELKATVLAVKNIGCRTIAVTGGRESWLAQNCDTVIYAGVPEEGGPLNRAPRNSINAEITALNALSVILQVEKDWDPVKYVRCHPGGKLGQIRENEKGLK